MKKMSDVTRKEIKQIQHQSHQISENEFNILSRELLYGQVIRVSHLAYYRNKVKHRYYFTTNRAFCITLRDLTTTCIQEKCCVTVNAFYGRMILILLLHMADRWVRFISATNIYLVYRNYCIVIRNVRKKKDQISFTDKLFCCYLLDLESTS